MQTIKLTQALPEVFHERRASIQSEVWLRDLQLERGRYYLIEASSGAGKSSLCSFLYGWRGDYSGAIAFDDEPLRGITPAGWSDIRRTQLAFLFQEMRLFEELSAWDNVWLKNQLTDFRTEAQVRELFDLMGLSDKLHSPARLLSLGQQQRVAALRALCQPFDFILLDEPISHLDEANAQTLARLVRESAERQGAGIIVTSVGKHLPLDYHERLHL